MNWILRLCILSLSVSTGCQKSNSKLDGVTADQLEKIGLASNIDLSQYVTQKDKSSKPKLKITILNTINSERLNSVMRNAVQTDEQLPGLTWEFANLDELKANNPDTDITEHLISLSGAQC